MANDRVCESAWSRSLMFEDAQPPVADKWCAALGGRWRCLRGDGVAQDLRGGPSFGDGRSAVAGGAKGARGKSLPAFPCLHQTGTESRKHVAPAFRTGPPRRAPRAGRGSCGSPAVRSGGDHRHRSFRHRCRGERRFRCRWRYRSGVRQPQWRARLVVAQRARQPCAACHAVFARERASSGGGGFRSRWARRSGVGHDRRHAGLASRFAADGAGAGAVRHAHRAGQRSDGRDAVGGR